MRNAKNETWSLDRHLPQVYGKAIGALIDSESQGWMAVNSLFLAVSIKAKDAITKDSLESQNLSFGAPVIW